jgi:hypothetical protein
VLRVYSGERRPTALQLRKFALGKGLERIAKMKQEVCLRGTQRGKTLVQLHNKRARGYIQFAVKYSKPCVKTTRAGNATSSNETLPEI